MDLDAAKGRRLRQVTFPVERSKLRELALALHDEDPVWHDPAAAAAAGFDGVPVPPTATVLAAHWAPGGLIGPPLELGLDRARLLHGESAWTFTGMPLRAGDELTATLTVADVSRREGRRGGTMTLLMIDTTFVNQRGEDVATLRDTWVERAL
jgi:acyl dehydratase